MRKQQNKWSSGKEQNDSSGKRCRSWTKGRAWLVLLLVIMAMPVQQVWGYGIISGYQHITKDNVKIDDTNFQDKGYVEITIPIIYNPAGADETEMLTYKYGNESSASVISFGNTPVIRFYTGDISTGNWNDCANKLHAKLITGDVMRLEVYAQGNSNPNEYTVVGRGDYQDVYVPAVESGSGPTYKQIGTAVFRVYPHVSLLDNSEKSPSELDVHVELRYGHSGDKSNFDYISKEKTVKYRGTKQTPDVADFGDTPGMYDISFTNKTPGEYFKVLKDNSLIGNADIGPDGKGTVQVDVMYDPITLTITYYSKISDYDGYNKENYLPYTSTKTLKGYEFPKELVVHYNGKGQTVLEWDIFHFENPTEDDLYKGSGDNFEIQRSDNPNFENPKTISTLEYIKKKMHYETIDDAANENLNGVYYYRLRRTQPGKWGWDYSRTANTQIVMKHVQIASAKATVTENGKVDITWENNDGNITTEGSKVILRRIKEENGETVEQELTNDEIYERACTVTIPTICDVYRYELYVKPGAPAYETQTPVAVESDPLYISSLGNIVSLNASKGYYSDRVALEWETDEGTIEMFSIQSRVYGSGQEFKQIDQMNASVSSKLYQYSDVKAVPGAIYEYQVVAMGTCGGVREHRPSDVSIGFRSPTGNVYGRVTYENGQAVSDVEVRTEVAEGAGITGKSYHFGATDYLSVGNAELLKDNTDSITLQAWVNMTATDGNIISKAGMYGLKIVDGKPVFTIGATNITADVPLSDFIQKDNEFVHLTAVATADSAAIYINGRSAGGKKLSALSRGGLVTGTDDAVTIGGGGFEGNIDEVRIWGIALDSVTIARDYTRYLTGGEKGLLAYYTFDYAVNNSFFDTSYNGLNYNENHGAVNGAALDSSTIPAISQLGYKGYTAADGSYSIRAIPYTGNGTTYMIIPRLGIHKFESEKELRLLNASSQSHTVNFTDKSSFLVTGKVTYKGGTIPVEGVSFLIDGVVSMDSKANIITTDANGDFSINVPVGTHEVKATKANHTFANEGKITNSDGTDRNYQDIVTGLELEDITTVRYIGRVAGGAIQEAYPLGHSLSKNNLADGVKVTLKYVNDAYILAPKDGIGPVEVPLHKPSYMEGEFFSEVTCKGSEVTILPDPKTGEFAVDVIPERFKVTVEVPGHDAASIPGNGEEINLTNAFATENSIYEYIDSVSVKGVYEQHTDTVRYNKSQTFIKRYAPTIRITQLDNTGKELPYFGEKEKQFQMALAENNYTVPIYDEATGKYALSKPVFEQYKSYVFKAKVFEGYVYMDQDGKPKADGSIDEVPTADAKVTYGDGLTGESQPELAVDEEGIVLDTMRVGNPELTSGIRSMTAKAVYGGENATFIDWAGGFDAIIVGAISTGNNFVTQGPDDVMFVLRDPPGSHSYSYLEKGTSIHRSSTYTGNIVQEGNEEAGLALGTKNLVYAGSPVAGTITETEFDNELKIGAKHTEEAGGSNTSEKTVTTTTRFQTSDDPLYVGADADVYVGFSTNIVFGATDNVTIVSREKYQKDGGAEAYKVLLGKPESDDWLLVKSTGLGVYQNYGTLFAYPQTYIEQTLIPNLESIRNSILHAPDEMTPEQAQALADQTKEQVYVSKLPRNDENFGKSNVDEVFDLNNLVDITEGESYKIYFPKESGKAENDTILTLNQSIDRWVQRMAENEEDKVNATLLQNYSFHAASQVEYSESFTYTFTRNVNFKIVIGASLATKLGTNILGQGVFTEINETLTQENGGEFVSTDEASRSNGFVLAEEDDDYISVDVCRSSGYRADDQYVKFSEADSNNKFTTFIFKTKAGATSCPYEKEYRTKYFEPGKHVINEATVQLEVPEIDVEKNFIENVPSGQPAYLKLFLRNNSEAKQDMWYVLKMVDGTNPYGARMSIDGSAIGDGRVFLVPSGETLVKTLEVSKGSVMNYDDLKLTLQSQCQCDPTSYQDNIADTVAFSVHFTPSCTDVRIKKPSNNWTYNTKLPTKLVNGQIKHYMDIQLDGFDVNYDNFNRIKLQYKAASASDEDWTTLMNYYNDPALYDQALANGLNAEMIDAGDAGTIRYQWMMDDMQDQYYDIRAVGVCLINNMEVENVSEVHSGIKDMYNPRLFGSAQPANGVLTINDDIRLNFNEKIAEGYLTDNNFEVTGVRNGAQTDHSVSVRLDGKNDFLSSEFERNWNGKDITVEMWVLADEAREATFFSQGNVNEALEFGITANNHLRVRVGNTEIISTDAVPYEQGTWAHVALVYDKAGKATAYYNFVEYITDAAVGMYAGEGSYAFGRNVNGGGNFAGKMHNARIWDKVLTSGRIQTNSLTLLSGAESNLLAYYPMNEAKGTTLLDKARGANLEMNGCEWALPEGRAANFDGKTYISLNTGSSVVVDNTMDYTIEFWFKAEPGQTDATLVANGRGDGQELGGSRNLFSIGFESGVLTFHNNEVKAVAEGDYLDNNWHHLALTVSRTTGRGQILMDGVLNTYFESQDIGGIAAAYIYLGARGWTSEEDALNVIVDNYFKGTIDDLRIWNLYKNETLVANGNNERLDGTEKGLMAYYPFEHYIDWQGTKELQFTLKDMKVQKDPTISIPDAVAYGGDAETAASAPVKDKGPVSKLLYDFVVNNDALIINLNETWDRVEKSIVTFTVDGVRDMNGNEILSPVTWSAYIDRNQLKWSETGMNIRKAAYEAKEFKVKAVNKGGSVQHFTIENAPAWLEVAPMSGTIDPLASLDITFTINEGLNIGSYDEVIYLRNDNNVSEALPLTVKVAGEKPDWSVNPAYFKYNMTVFGKMRFNGVFSADKEDMLAVFVNGQCRGVANSSYDKIGDLWYAFLTVYSNEVQSSDLEFRMWDASTGKVYSATPNKTIIFVNDNIVGSADEPVLFDGKEMFYQNMALTQGWNWVSFNLSSPNLADVTTAMKYGQWNNGDIIKNKDYFDSYSVSGNRWTGSLSGNGGLDNTSLFMIKASAEQTLSLSGNAINAKETLITVKGKNWNYIGYLPSINFTVTEALAGYDAKKGDIVKSQNQFSMYSGTRWIGNLTYMEANKGYMLFRNEEKDASFIYPSTSGSLSNTRGKARTRSAENAPEAYLNSNYAENMNIVAAGTDIEPTDRILAYVNGELRGVGENVATATGDMQFITVAGSEAGNTVTFSLERNGKVIARANNAVSYRSNTVQGTMEQPIMLDFSTLEGNVSFYPNPFVDKLNIRITAENDGELKLAVYDITGRILLQRAETVYKGLHTTEWDGKTAEGSECEAGIYLIHVTVDGKTTILKVEKK
ncbi:LamG-like jellyroll fold domain-containing protein [Bacteroides sp.]